MRTRRLLSATVAAALLAAVVVVPAYARAQGPATLAAPAHVAAPAAASVNLAAPAVRWGASARLRWAAPADDAHAAPGTGDNGAPDTALPTATPPPPTAPTSLPDPSAAPGAGSAPTTGPSPTAGASTTATPTTGATESDAPGSTPGTHPSEINSVPGAETGSPALPRNPDDSGLVATSETLAWPDQTIIAGSTAILRPNNRLPDGALIAATAGLPGWAVREDQARGELVVTAPSDAVAGTINRIAVRVIFPDGSEADDLAHVQVIGRLSPPASPNEDSIEVTEAHTTEVVFADVTLHPGESVVVIPKGLPSGAKVYVPETRSGGFTVAREGNTGIRVTASATVSPGSRLHVNAGVQFTDGSTNNHQFDTAVVRGDAQADTSDINYTPTHVAPGSKVKIEPLGDLPEDVEFSVGITDKDWKVKVNRTSGRLSIRAPRDVEEATTIPVIATFADGSTKRISVDVYSTPTNPINPVVKLPSMSGPAPVVKTTWSFAPDLYSIIGGALPAVPYPAAA